MYGETHVDPAVLFDLTGGRPPADAIEVYIPTPMSLCLLGDAVHGDPQHRHLWPDLAELYASVMNDAAGGAAAGGRRRVEPVPPRPGD